MNNENQLRNTFERECFAYYQRIKAAGWSNPEEGDATSGSLFWRQENGKYGVRQIEAAWQGFQMAFAARKPIELNVIRRWPDGMDERLEHVWRDLVGFIPSYKLYDLQRMLAEYGFEMVVYEKAGERLEQ